MRPEYNYIHRNLVPDSIEDCESTSLNHMAATAMFFFMCTALAIDAPYYFPESEPISRIAY